MPKSTSLWRDTTSVPERPPLTADAECDVCIVGAGIAGLTTAYLLAREGQRVIVLDAGDVGAGESGVTSAHLSNEMDASYARIAGLHGPAGARLACDSHTAAIDTIERIVDEESIACSFTRVDGYLFLADGQNERVLEDELEAARAAGADVMRLPDAGVTGFATGPCIRFNRQAQFHPLQYLAGLAAAVERRGGRIHGRTRVIAAEGGSASHVRTADGHRIAARAIAIATNSPFNDLVAIHTKQAPYQTYVIGARVQPGHVTTALYWDTAEPYHYVRLQRTTERALGGDTDDDVEILIVGGEDHKSGQAKDADERFGRLEAWMRAHVPAAGPVEFRWSGQVMETVDGLAFIGRNPLDYANVYIATGDCGMGLTHGTIAGMLLCDLMQGRQNPWADLYDPSRKTTASALEWLKENANVALQYKDWFTGGDVESADQITPMNGAILVEGGRKIATYRDERGELHKRSAVCPHLGCIVQWNPSASTWDCPCHGSRFDKFGAVINGPSQNDLEAPPNPRST